MSFKVPVGISARHIHVTREDLDILFGKGYELTHVKDLSQPGQFASAEQIDLVTEKGSINKVRILGPLRSKTQVELAFTDALKLKIKIPVRDSGDVEGSAAIKVVGPAGTLDLKEGAIAACRHIHMTPADAEEFGFKDKDIAKVTVPGERKLVFDNVIVRVSDSYKLELHLDTDEGNAALINTGDEAEFEKA